MLSVVATFYVRLTIKRLVLLGVVAALLVVGAVLEETERQDLRMRLDSAAAQGARTIRLQADEESLRIEHCATVNRLSKVSVVYLATTAPGEVIAVGNLSIIYPNAPVGWLYAAGPNDSEPGVIATGAGLNGHPLPESLIAIPDAKSTTVAVASTAPPGGTCLVESSWNDRDQLASMVAGAVPDIDWDIRAVSDAPIVDEIDRFNQRGANRLPLLFGAFAGLTLAALVLERRRYIAVLMSAGHSENSSILAVLATAVLDLATAHTVALSVLAVLLAKRMIVELGGATVAGLLVISAAMCLASTGLGFAVVRNYRAYFRTDD